MKHQTLSLFFVVLPLQFVSLHSSAQTTTKSPEEISPAAIRYVSPVETTWEFGLKVTSSGNASGISATIPIPMDWPEQTITHTTPEKSDNVVSLKITNPTKETRQLVFTVHHLAAGETAQAVMRFQITKQMIVAPHDPTQLKIPKSVSSKLKTFLKPSPQIESKHPRIREIAQQLSDESLKNSLNGWQQVEAVYKWVRENVQYEFDTEIHSCLDALDAKQGDCEELSSLIIAICRAMKIPARAVWIPGHTYPEFYLEDDQGNGYWIPCQAAGEYQFGAMTELRPVLQKGDRFRLPGKSGYVRYVQPTLMAKDADGQLSIEWISREVP